MTLSIDRLSVWLPGRGTVLSNVSVTFDGVALVVGRNGSGTTTLLRAIGGLLPAGARVAGAISLDGVSLGRPTGAELAGVIDTTHLTALAEGPVAPLLAGTDPAVVALLGIQPAANVAELSDQERAALAVVRACAEPAAPVVLFDQPLADVSPRHRPLVGALIRGLANAGTTVVWAEHHIEEALTHADVVAEIVSADSVRTSPPRKWRPRTLPAPPAMAAARILGLPHDEWIDPPTEAFADVVVGAGPSSGPRGSQHRRRDAADVVTTANPANARLDREIDLRAGECLGIVSTTFDRDREIDVARRLTAIAQGKRTLPTPVSAPRGVRLDRSIRAWERTRQLPPGIVGQHLDHFGPLDLRKTPLQLSSGEATRFDLALALTNPGPRLLIEPTRFLDPVRRRAVATTLFNDTVEATFLVSNDIEVFVRACHRVLVIDDDSIVADGTPHSVLDRLPHQPQLVRLGLRAVRVEALR